MLSAVAAKRPRADTAGAASSPRMRPLFAAVKAAPDEDAPAAGGRAFPGAARAPSDALVCAFPVATSAKVEAPELRADPMPPLRLRGTEVVAVRPFLLPFCKSCASYIDVQHDALSVVSHVAQVHAADPAECAAAEAFSARLAAERASLGTSQRDPAQLSWFSGDHRVAIVENWTCRLSSCEASRGKPLGSLAVAIEHLQTAHPHASDFDSVLERVLVKRPFVNNSDFVAIDRPYPRAAPAAPLPALPVAAAGAPESDPPPVALQRLMLQSAEIIVCPRLLLPFCKACGKYILLKVQSAHLPLVLHVRQVHNGSQAQQAQAKALVHQLFEARAALPPARQQQLANVDWLRDDDRISREDGYRCLIPGCTWAGSYEGVRTHLKKAHPGSSVRRHAERCLVKRPFNAKPAVYVGPLLSKWGAGV